MFVNSHAAARLDGRLPMRQAAAIRQRLEDRPGLPGSLAYVVGNAPRQIYDGIGGDESNGDLIVAIAREGEVTTIMYRRSTQPLTPQALGVDRIIVWGD